MVWIHGGGDKRRPVKEQQKEARVLALFQIMWYISHGEIEIERPASPAKTTTLPAATANASQPSESIQDASLTVGDRICVMINEERCMGNLCYLGPLEFHPETELFCGIQLDRPRKHSSK